jgi:ABC-2 type transport system ATP-binding protein
VAKEFEIDKWLNEYVERYSSGMKCKLSLCRVLLLDPKILFLDEPTLGLDVKTTNFIISKLKSLNKTIFVTSHNMEVIDKLCTKIAFINKGKIIKYGSKEELQDLFQKSIKIHVGITDGKSKLKEELEEEKYVSNVSDGPEGLSIELVKRSFYNNLIKILGRYNILKIKEIDMTIEDLFLKIV